MRNRSRAALCAIAGATVGPAEADTLPSDYLRSILRFGIECHGSAKPRNVYLGNAERFALQVDKPAAPSSEAVKRAPARVTYRAFYRDMISQTWLRARRVSSSVSRSPD